MCRFGSERDVRLGPDRIAGAVLLAGAVQVGRPRAPGRCPGSRLQVVRVVRMPRLPAPQAVERAKRVGLPAPTRRPPCLAHSTGTQPPGGATSTNPAGSKSSASNSMPSITRGPGLPK